MKMGGLLKLDGFGVLHLRFVQSNLSGKAQGIFQGQGQGWVGSGQEQRQQSLFPSLWVCAGYLRAKCRLLQWFNFRQLCLVQNPVVGAREPSVQRAGLSEGPGALRNGRSENPAHSYGCHPVQKEWQGFFKEQSETM